MIHYESQNILRVFLRYVNAECKASVAM